jgi:hypothetical protein
MLYYCLIMFVLRNCEFLASLPFRGEVVVVLIPTVFILLVNVGELLAP